MQWFPGNSVCDGIRFLLCIYSSKINKYNFYTFNKSLCESKNLIYCHLLTNLVCQNFMFSDMNSLIKMSTFYKDRLDWNPLYMVKFPCSSSAPRLRHFHSWWEMLSFWKSFDRDSLGKYRREDRGTLQHHCLTSLLQTRCWVALMPRCSW